MGSKKSIVIAITGHILTDQRIIRIASKLQQNNFNVLVIFRPHFKFRKQENKPVNPYTFKTRKLNFSINSGILFYAIFNIRLFFLLLFKKYDIYCAVDSDTLFAFTLLSKLKGVPLVYDAHEYFAEVPELEGKALKQKIWHWVTAYGIAQSKARYTVSESLAKELKIRYGLPFACVRNVPAYKERNDQIKFNIPTILYQGALNKGRELELLISAMKKLPEYNCIIIGEGDLSASLRASAKGIRNIEFMGLMTPEKINSITQRVFFGYNLLESKSKSYYHSLSNKYFDYMQAGVPSISSLLPEYEFLNLAFKCGLCIENNEAELIHILKYYLNNKLEYENLEQNALLASLKNNWELESQKLLQIYTDI